MTKKSWGHPKQYENSSAKQVKFDPARRKKNSYWSSLHSDHLSSICNFKKIERLSAGSIFILSTADAFDCIYIYICIKWCNGISCFDKDME